MNQEARQAALRILTFAFVLLGIVLFVVYAVYPRLMNGVWPAWTGFGEYTDPKDEYYRAKTLWDLLALIIIPVILGAGVLWFNEQRAKTERELAADRQREDALQNYLDKMSELLLKENLLEMKESEGDPTFVVAQVRTVTTLRMLDTTRRNVLLQFLQDSNLSGFILKSASMSNVNLSMANLFRTDLSYADLSNADLTRANLYESNLYKAFFKEADIREADLGMANLNQADLTRAILIGANMFWTHLRRTDLTGANLFRAILVNADLSNADLSEANLRDANLYMADLSDANLSQANLLGANLSEADMRGADLSGTKVSKKHLSKVESLEGAIMPDGTKHE